MNIQFFYDPSCPFCWITSRWLVAVAPKRNLTIDWQPFSLAIKNNELQPSADQSPYAQFHRDAHRILRVIEAAAATGADRGKLYSDFGAINHVEGNPYDETAIEIVLGINQLDLNLKNAADDLQQDKALQASLDKALAIVGNDVGVPIIVFERDDKPPIGYFGPVLQALPSEGTSLVLWDGLVALATTDEFYELKRSRPQGMPNTGSTATTLGPAVC